MVFRERERGALDLLLLSGEQCAGGQVRGGALGLGIGWAREGRFSRALVPVCAVNVSVCDVPM